MNDLINKITLGDCLEAMKRIPDKSVDLVLTDPPYNMGVKNEAWDKYRNLTPLEWERLQTLPEGYTSVLPKTKRCEVIGDAWTVDVIVHILKGLK